jgi:hypothetical protein
MKISRKQLRNLLKRQLIIEIEAKPSGADYGESPEEAMARREKAEEEEKEKQKLKGQLIVKAIDKKREELEGAVKEGKDNNAFRKFVNDKYAEEEITSALSDKGLTGTLDPTGDYNNYVKAAWEKFGEAYLYEKTKDWKVTVLDALESDPDADVWKKIELEDELRALHKELWSEKFPEKTEESEKPTGAIKVTSYGHVFGGEKVATIRVTEDGDCRIKDTKVFIGDDAYNEGKAYIEELKGKFKDLEPPGEFVDDDKKPIEKLKEAAEG